MPPYVEHPYPAFPFGEGGVLRERAEGILERKLDNRAAWTWTEARSSAILTAGS